MTSNDHVYQLSSCLTFTATFNNYKLEQNYSGDSSIPYISPYLRIFVSMIT